MSLKKIKRAEKKGTESVMDEKFALLFWSEFAVGNGEFSYQVRQDYSLRLESSTIFMQIEILKLLNSTTLFCNQIYINQI